jgi:hypothetical protein
MYPREQAHTTIENSLACIGLRGFLDSKDRPSAALIKVCFEVKSLYIKGVIVEERFYELRKSNGGGPRGDLTCFLLIYIQKTLCCSC